MNSWISLSLCLKIFKNKRKNMIENTLIYEVNLHNIIFRMSKMLKKKYI